VVSYRIPIRRGIPPHDWQMEGVQMNEQLLNKLLEYIDAAIDAKSEQANSEDGGLIEQLRKFRVRDELFSLIKKEAKP
jgi:hypothetical protein